MLSQSPETDIGSPIVNERFHYPKHQVLSWTEFERLFIYLEIHVDIWGLSKSLDS